MDIFTNTNVIELYETSSDTTITNKVNTYNMKNCLGLDEDTNIMKGSLKKYSWNSSSASCHRLIRTDPFFDDAIGPTIESMGIKNYYDSHPGVTEHPFTKKICTTVTWDDTDGTNFSKSLGQATVTLVLTIYTERGTTTPEITGIAAQGNCVDLYDYRTYGNDDWNGYASRVQTCHTENIREAGEIFWSDLSLIIPETHFWIDVYYNDLDTLKSKLQTMSL